MGANAATGSYASPIGGYKLTATADGPFVSFRDNTESIFSIENGASSNGGVNGALAYMLGPARNSLNALVGRNLIATNPNLYVASFWEPEIREEQPCRSNKQQRVLATSLTTITAIR